MLMTAERLADAPVKAPVTEVWTALLQDGGEGWVLGVFTTRDKAIEVIEQYIRKEEGSPTRLNDPASSPNYIQIGFGDDEDDDVPHRIIITDYVLDELGV